MYAHPTHRIDPTIAFAFLRERGFGTLVVPGTSHPLAAHVPFLVHATEDGGVRAEFHVARANGIHAAVGPDGVPALMICQGPDAYISPDWYGVPDQVPTWTYVSVHLSGRLSLVAESDGRAHVDRLSAEFERRLAPKPPWRADKMQTQRLEAMLRAIVIMELAVPADGIAAQHKLIQHKGLTEHKGAIAGLRASGGSDAAQIATLMEKTLTERGVKR